MPDSRVIHVVFGSADGSLRKAVAKAGWLEEEVVHTHDLFAIGPIAAGPSTAAAMTARAQAVDEILFTDIWSKIVADNAPLLAASLAEDVRPVVWFSRRDTQSYAGFLWWLSHRGDGPCDVVDLTETILPARKVRGETLPAELAISPAVVPAVDLVDLRGEARPLSPEERRRYQRMWQALVRQNTALRVIEGDELVSAPITYFDDLLLSWTTHQWRKMFRIFLETYCGFKEQGLHQAGDLLIHARLRALVSRGALDVVGDPSRMEYCEVRWPSSSAD